MSFTPETTVGDAIKADPSVVDRLVALHPTFSKLRNPMLRKVMARLVTLREASRVAGVPLGCLMEAVNGRVDDPCCAFDTEGDLDAKEPRPGWMDRFVRKKARVLDVRPLLSAGVEPLGKIMREAAKVREGGFLALQAPFDPAPLRRVLAGKGFVSYGRRIADGHWEIIFLRDAEDATVSAPQEIPADGAGAHQWREDGVSHIDVRGLHPPQPMLAILSLLETPGEAGPVIVHHEREPLFLYPELAERGWLHEIIAGEPGEVRLRLTRDRAI